MDKNFEEKMKIVEKANAEGKDPAQAVADYMKTITQ